MVMNVLYIILWAFAVLCFALAVPGRFDTRWNLIALGLFFGALAFLLQTIYAVV